MNKVYLGDCLELMKDIEDKSVDMILCDLPYGTTRCKWDVVIPFDKLWEQYNRIIKDNGAIVLTGAEPFSSYLRLSNIKNYRYDLKWEKTKSTGFFDAKKRPLNNFEDICIFYKKQPTYNPQMTIAEKTYKRGFVKRKKSDCYGEERDFKQIETGQRYPKRIIKIPNADTKNIVHPTQKPVALYEYLIKTYTNEGNVILDNCAGSGTLIKACYKTNRRYICIENEEKYFRLLEEEHNNIIKEKERIREWHKFLQNQYERSPI